MILGSVPACFLDNTIPGTLEEKFMLSYNEATESGSDKELIRKVYHVPGTEWLISKAHFLRKMPFVQ